MHVMSRTDQFWFEQQAAASICAQHRQPKQPRWSTVEVLAAGTWMATASRVRLTSLLSPRWGTEPRRTMSIKALPLAKGRLLPLV